MDKRTDRFPLCSTGPRSLWGRCPDPLQLKSQTTQAGHGYRWPITAFPFIPFQSQEIQKVEAVGCILIQHFNFTTFWYSMFVFFSCLFFFLLKTDPNFPNRYINYLLSCISTIQIAQNFLWKCRHQPSKLGSDWRSASYISAWCLGVNEYHVLVNA